ncbi:MAG: T9SS type A sorting domain-containing protein [Ignavibacteria bacterium]|nr:T9SS type A sorting domain-containing protein [Ignavibacteria bacterium]
MKTFILIVTLTASQCLAQMTLTSSNNPVAGDLDNYVICDTNNITQGNSGANQNWSFLNLIRQDSTSVNFVTAASTPYSAQFPSSNLASTNDNSNYNYITTSSSSMLINGLAGPSLLVSYTDPQLYLQYPFTFNSGFSDNLSATYSISGSTVTRTGTTTVSGDAWGTINLPIGSFSNSLRVKYNITTRDSSNPGIPFVTETNVTSYIWFVPGRKFPVFEIIYSTITVNGAQFGNNKTVNYNAGSTIGITNISSAIPDSYTLSQNYPNPFNPVTNLEFGISMTEFVSLKIYDMLGKEVATLVNEELDPGTYKYSFDASGLTSGIYFYKITAGDFTETKRMNLIK